MVQSTDVNLQEIFFWSLQFEFAGTRSRQITVDVALRIGITANILSLTGDEYQYIHPICPQQPLLNSFSSRSARVRQQCLPPMKMLYMYFFLAITTTAVNSSPPATPHFIYY